MLRPLSLITVSKAGYCSSQTLPAFTVAEQLGAFSKFFPFLDTEVLLVLLTCLQSEQWGELEHLAQCFRALVTGWSGAGEVCGVPEDGSCHQLKAVSVPGVVTIHVFHLGPSSTRWRWQGCSVLLGKLFPRVLLCYFIHSCYRR